MGEKPTQRVSLWSQLDMWHSGGSVQPIEGRYESLDMKSWAPICRLCGCPVHLDYIASHDAYHEEQGY